MQLDGQLDEFPGVGARASQVCPPLCPGQRHLTLLAPPREAPSLSALANAQEGREGAAGLQAR